MLARRAILVASTLSSIEFLSMARADTTSFAGTYTRSSVSPSSCIQPSDCSYQCSAGYIVTVSGSTAIVYPTTSVNGCSCYIMTATISGSTASSSSRGFAMTLTSDGVEVDAVVSGSFCHGTYTKTTSPSTPTPATTLLLAATTTTSQSPSAVDCSNNLIVCAIVTALSGLALFLNMARVGGGREDL